MSIDSRESRINRRSFLIKGSLFIASFNSLFFCSCPSFFHKKTVSGAIAGANWNAGHLLRGNIPKHDGEERTNIVIVGGGIAGLSAARELQKNGVDNFMLLELGNQPGGNAASGVNAVSAYPWGAHYIPIPGKEAVHVRELFEELGIITGYDGTGLPIYNDYHLCADPQERLFIHGQWQEGLVPQYGVPENDRRQIREFLQAMAEFRTARGHDGKRAFVIPVDESSKDDKFTQYDTISMSTFLTDHGWNSPYLRWYVNYCCRDDYGCRVEDVSAWAGIHYFASRNGQAANAEPQAVVTWPNGIGWIVGKMSEKIGRNIRTEACVLNIENTADGASLDYLDLKSRKVIRVKARSVIYAAPRFTAFRTIRNFREKIPEYAASLDYAPWMVANVTVRGLPEGRGAALSWDNVSYYSHSLGYVVATHQDVALQRDRTVLTYYYPLTELSPSAERARALKQSYQDWTQLIVRDLVELHPGIEDHIDRLDVWLWGHAMARPVPGFFWGKARRSALQSFGNIHFAHSDMSGISIFEEAQYRGIMASRAVLFHDS